MRSVCSHFRDGSSSFALVRTLLLLRCHAKAPIGVHHRTWVVQIKVSCVNHSSNLLPRRLPFLLLCSFLDLILASFSAFFLYNVSLKPFGVFVKRKQSQYSNVYKRTIYIPYLFVPETSPQEWHLLQYS